MPRAKAKVDNYTFVKGLITEAGPLTFPENASLDENNFVLNRDGSRQVRKGMDFEEGYELVSTGITEDSLGNSPVSYHSWPLSAGDVSEIGVVRIFNKFWFVGATKPNASSSLLNQGNPITISGLSQGRVSTTAINGKLILVSGDLEKVQEFSYDLNQDVVYVIEHELLVRDIWGIAEPLEVDERPSTLTNIHRYNLQNQGWSPLIVHTCASGNAITCTKDTINKYPSNADIWSYGKVASTASADYNEYSPTELIKNSTGNTPAPKGRFIINLYNRGISRQANVLKDNTKEPSATTQWTPPITIGDETVETGTHYREKVNTETTGLPADQELGRVSCTASYAGRVFYSGIESRVLSGDKNSPDLSGYILFSPTIITNDKIGNCYPEADPTSEKISDVVDTDGGVIHIPEAVGIKKLVAVANSLLVFAENGVWEIYGADDIFTATSFAITRVTNVGTDNPDAIVLASDAILYWSFGGIYLVTKEDVSGRAKVQNLSTGSIQGYFDSIPAISKKYASGIYEEKEQRVRWMFNDLADYTENNILDRYNKELILDLSLQAFYPHSFSVPTTSKIKVVGYVKQPNFISDSVQSNVTVNGDYVQVNGDGVYIETLVNNNLPTKTKFITLKVVSGLIYFTFSSYSNENFYDWVKTLGISSEGQYIAYLVTGYTILGDGARNKQVPYLVMFFNQTEDGYDTNMEFVNPSSCFVQSQWQWTNSADSNKWGTKFQAYRLRQVFTPNETGQFNNGQSVVVTKNKLRGIGKSLSLLIESEAGKDLHLLGWSMDITANANI